jgi:catechol 2,3-dioxygenase-like lactoylglutathione lyase family enzyme
MDGWSACDQEINAHIEGFCQDHKMSIQLLGLRTVIYPAQDLAAAKTWWSHLLGEGPYFDEAFYVGFNVGGYELGLLPDADPADGALTYWGVDDVPSAVSAAIADGAFEHAGASEVGDGIVTASVRTPDGSIVGFIFNPHFKL